MLPTVYESVFTVKLVERDLVSTSKSVYSGGKDKIAIRVTSIHFCRKNSLPTFCASYDKKNK